MSYLLKTRFSFLMLLVAACLFGFPKPIETAQNRVQGLAAEYYDWAATNSEVLRRVDPVVDFDSSRNPIGNASPGARQGVRWSGFLEPRFNEDCSLILRGNGGVCLWFNNELVIHKWPGLTIEEARFTFPAKTGTKYRIVIECHSHAGPTALQFLWESRSESRSLVPQSQLSPAEDFTFSIPATSAVSPVFLEGIHAPGLAVVASANSSPVPATALSERHAYLNVPLSKAESTRVAIKWGEATATGTIEWTPTDIRRGGSMVLRAGDSLLLTSEIPATISVQSEDSRRSLSIEPSKRVPFRFDTPGAFRLSAAARSGENRRKGF